MIPLIDIQRDINRERARKRRIYAFNRFVIRFGLSIMAIIVVLGSIAFVRELFFILRLILR